ncbi:fanconi anemia group I-like protein isoform X2 [Wolffia australiana]
MAASAQLRPLPADVVLLAKSSSSAPLPPPETHSALLSNLLLPPSPSLPLSLYLSSLLSLFSNSPPSIPASSLLSSLLVSFLRLFRSRKTPRDPPTCRLFHLFSLRLSSLDKPQLESVLDAALSDLSAIADSDDALMLDLVPRCLDLIVAGWGPRSADPVLDRILESDWSRVSLVKIVSLLGEFPVAVRGKAMAIAEKALGSLDDVEVQDLPSVAYQLLLLAGKGFDKKRIVCGILSFFGSGRVKGAAGIVRQVEGTVLMHFNFAVKQDPALGKEVMGIVRREADVVNHFCVAVVLSIARVRRLNESSILLLRSLAVGCYGDYRDCKWLPPCIKEECLSTAKCVEKSLMRAINENNSGREYIVPSSVQLGFALLEPVEVLGGRASERFDDPEQLMGAKELGIWILKMIFEVHDMARNEIIEKCKLRILSLKPQEISSMTKLLGTLIQSFPYPMLEQNGRLKDLLDYFSFMHGNPARAVVLSMLPLIRLSRDLQDYIILVVRKAMFRKEDGVRLAATYALVDLILADASLRRSCQTSLEESSSQASCSQQVEVPRRTGIGLFQELSGLLRRCLSQEAEIREVIYHGLMELVLLDPLLSGAVFDFLWPHFLRFYKEDAKFPLAIDSCITEEKDRVYVKEPLDCLLYCVSWVFVLQPSVDRDQTDHSFSCFGFSLSQDNEGGRTSSRECFSNALKKIRQALTLDNIKDFFSLKDEKRKCCLQILSGVVEVFANVAAVELEKSENTEKTVLENQILDLSVLHHSLEIDQPPSKPSRSTPKPFLATSSIQRLLISAVERHDDISGSDGQNSSSHLALASFALKACLNKLRYFDDRDGNEYATRSGLIDGDIKMLARPLLELVWRMKKTEAQSETQRKKEFKGKNNFLHLSLTCLKELLRISLRKDETLAGLVEELVINLDLSQKPESGYPLGENLNNFLNKWTKPLVSEFLSQSLFSEFEVLMELVAMVGGRLPGRLREAHGIWAVDLCRRSDLKNPKAASGLLALAVDLHSPPGDLVVAEEMARALTEVLGSEDRDPVENSKAYPTLNRSTGTAVASAFLRWAESVLVDFDWALSKLNTLTSRGLALEEAFYSRSEALVNLLSCFVRMHLNDSQAEHLLKLAARFYKILARATKLRLAPAKSKQNFPSCRSFQRLAEVTCRQLTAPLYSFLALIQRNQRDAAENGGKGLSGKIKRENRWVPELVFRIEDYEKNLIQLSRLTGVNLLRRAKTSTARDFKILDPVRVGRVKEDDGPDGGAGEDSDAGPAPEVNSGGDSEPEDERRQTVMGSKKIRKVIRSSDEEP